ncbi:MAG: hemolysin family protein [Candidatus Macondimonas sp.]
MDLLLLPFLILLNALFALSEMAVVSSRQARLQNLAERKHPGASVALALHESPSNFLSTIQVGITTVGILSGAVGERTLADPLAAWLANFPTLGPYSHSISLGTVVIGLTFFSVVVGELVPKRLALLAPESVASRIALPMHGLSRVARPLVVILATASDLILRLLGARARSGPSVSDEEIRVLMQQGAEAGIFHESEQALVANVLRLDQQPVQAIMTPRREIRALNLEAPAETMRENLLASDYTRMVVCRGELDQIVGILQAGDLLRRMLAGAPFTADEVAQAAQPPLFVPESMTTTRLLEKFRQVRQELALIVDEYGDLQGLVTLTDVLKAIIGELHIPQTPEEESMIQREDGSWLVDGSLSLQRFQVGLQLPDDWIGDADGEFHTLGGFVMSILGRIPRAGDHFTHNGLRFEVLDMDGHRVDKILVSAPPASEGIEEDGSPPLW